VAERLASIIDEGLNGSRDGYQGIHAVDVNGSGALERLLEH